MRLSPRFASASVNEASGTPDDGETLADGLRLGDRDGDALFPIDGEVLALGLDETLTLGDRLGD
jgi:hypothetical protein